ncbi:MAG: winged helix-turn-helix domain-containing protein [Nitrospinaceae bacterium]
MALTRKKPFICKPRIRVLAAGCIALGPGKVDLLEAIQRTGSISQAAKENHLSYRRAWDMVDTMNRCFKKPLVTGFTGGKGGGGAALTPLGKRMVLHYRAMESAARKATQTDWKTIRKYLKPPPGSS